MSPTNRRNLGGVSAHAGSASARRSHAESASGPKKGFANRNVKRKAHSGIKPRGEKTRPLKSTSASLTPKSATKTVKKEINKTSVNRRPAPAAAVAGKKGSKAAPAKKSPLKKTALNTKEHGGLYNNEMRLSAASSPVTSSTTTASSLRLSPSAFVSTSCGRSPRASAGAGGGFSPSAYNASLAQCSPKSEGTRRQADLGSTRNIRKSGGLFSWLWKIWS